MKIHVETSRLQNPGVVLEAETEAEKELLSRLWLYGRPVEYERDPRRLTIAPVPEEESK